MLRVLGLVLALALSSATRADAATFATEIFADPGLGVPASGQTSRYLPSNALGPTPANPLSSFWSGGIGGISIFGFGGPIIGGGSLIEATGNCTGINSAGLCTGTNQHQEQAKLFAIGGPIDFGPLADGLVNGEQVYDLSGILSRPDLFEVGDIQNGEAQGAGFAFDLTAALASLGTINYLMVVDTTALLPNNGGSSDGFDIVSISATPVPLPPAALLLAASLAGLGFMARRRRS